MSRLNLKDFSSNEAKVKYACARQAVTMSKERPAEVYPDFDFFARLLDSANNVIKWTAIQVVGNLSKVDEQGRVDKLIPQLIGFLNCGRLITAGNAILALSEVAFNKPAYLDRIADELLRVEGYTYNTPECGNIAIGLVLSALMKLDGVWGKGEVLSFVERQTRNPRPATRKKAQSALRRMARNR